jgi:hypothetical protein
MLVAAGGGFVYWVQGDPGAAAWSMRRVSESGGSPQLVVAAIDELPIGLAVDATRVYWTGGPNSNSLLSAPNDGADPGAAPTTITSELSSPGSVVVAGPVAFVADAHAVMSVSLADGTASIATVGDANYFGAGPLAVANALMVVNHGSCTVGTSSPCTSTTVLRYAPGDAAATQLYGSANDVDGFATDGTHAYLAEKTNLDFGADHILSLDGSGAPPGTVLAAAPTGVHSLVATEGTLYWSSGVGTVYSMPAAGGTPTQITEDTVTTLVADAGQVFGVTTLADGTSAIVRETK